MRLNKLFILYSLFGILMASCIKDEAPNAEADITGISFEEDVLASARFNLNPSYNDNLQAYPLGVFSGFFFRLSQRAILSIFLFPFRIRFLARAGCGPILGSWRCVFVP